MPEDRSDLSQWFRSSDEVRTGFISGETFDRKEVTYSVIDGMAVFEGDIILGTVEQMEGKVPAPRGVGQPGSGFRWPGGRIPWGLRRANAQLRQLVLQAIQHWERNTNIRFVERTAANQDRFPDYLSFRADRNECSSFVGRQGGVQFVYLGPGCGFGAAVHEIGHAIGLWHEQSREDRNAYVRIRWENIEPGQEHNFNQHITDGDDVGTYDFDSIMHYPRLAFSRNGQPTIEPLGGQAIGQRTGLSAGDIAAVRVMYQRTPPILAASEPRGYQGGGAARVVYRGRDNDVHEIWLAADGWQQWNMGAGIGAARAAGTPRGYQGGEAARVVYRGPDNHVHELALAGTWGHYVMTAGRPATALAAGDPMGYRGGGTDRVVYRGQDNHVYEIWLSGTGWQQWNMSAALGAPRAAGDPIGYQGVGAARVVYRSQDIHVREIWLSGTGWQHFDYTAATRAPLATGNPKAYQGGGTDRLVYRGQDGHVYEIWLSGTGWQQWNMSAALGAPRAAGDPIGYQGVGAARVVYRGTDNHIHEFGLAGTWGHFVMTGGLPLGAGDPMGYQSSGRDRVVYRGFDNHVHEIALAGTWRHEDLTPFAR